MFAPLLLLAVAAVQEPAPEIPPLIDAGNIAYMKGDYETARQSFLQAWDLAQQKPPSDPVRYDVLKRLTSVRNAAGDFADADNFLQMAINWRENVFGQNDARVAEDLLISISLSRGLKNYDRALLILSRVMGIHRIAYGADSNRRCPQQRTSQTERTPKNLARLCRRGVCEGAVGLLRAIRSAPSRR